MFSYLMNRWTIARRFEKVETGYIYWRRPHLPGVEVSEEERLETLREFRRRYLKSSFTTLVGAIAVAVLLALVAVVLDFGEGAMAFSGYGFAAVLCILILREQRVWSALPEQRFADRPRVPSDVEEAGWFVRYQRQSRKRSWPVHAGLIAIYGAISWLLMPRSLDANIQHWFFFMCFVVSLVLLIYGAVLKVREPSGQ